MLSDLRMSNIDIQSLGHLQPGIPLPSSLPKSWPMILIDLKDYFFTILLHELERERFAFSVPTYHNSGPIKCSQMEC